MTIGYARVSTEDQNLDLQTRALEKAGCETVYFDHGISGKDFERPGLGEAMAELTTGSTFVVWRLDRLGRSLPKLIEFVDEIGRHGAHFCSLTENIDTSSSGGRLIFHIMGALAEFERALISERTRAGMEAAKSRGVHLGRRPSMNLDQVVEARRALANGVRAEALAARIGITERTLRRHLCIKDAS